MVLNSRLTWFATLMMHVARCRFFANFKTRIIVAYSNVSLKLRNHFAFPLTYTKSHWYWYVYSSVVMFIGAFVHINGTTDM